MSRNFPISYLHIVANRITIILWATCRSDGNLTWYDQSLYRFWCTLLVFLYSRGLKCKAPITAHFLTALLPGMNLNALWTPPNLWKETYIWNPFHSLSSRVEKQEQHEQGRNWFHLLAFPRLFSQSEWHSASEEPDKKGGSSADLGTVQNTVHSRTGKKVQNKDFSDQIVQRPGFQRRLWWFVWNRVKEGTPSSSKKKKVTQKS